MGGRFLSICLKKKSLCSLKIRSYLVIFSKGKVVWSQDFAVHLVSWSPYLGWGSLRCPEDSARASWDSPASHSRDSSLNLAAFLAWQMFPLQLLPSGNLAHNRLATYEPTAQQLPSSEPPPKGATLLLDASAFQRLRVLDEHLKCTACSLLFFSVSFIFSKGQPKTEAVYLKLNTACLTKYLNSHFQSRSKQRLRNFEGLLTVWDALSGYDGHFSV